MKWLKHHFQAVRQRLYAWLVPPYRTCMVEGHLPAVLKKRTLYIVQEDGFLEQAAMICPCGCGKTLHMNLLTDERPCWRVTQHGDGTASLHPSVWRKKDCGSHFLVETGPCALVQNNLGKLNLSRLAQRQTLAFRNQRGQYIVN